MFIRKEQNNCMLPTRKEEDRSDLHHHHLENHRGHHLDEGHRLDHFGRACHRDPSHHDPNNHERSQTS